MQKNLKKPFVITRKKPQFNIYVDQDVFDESIESKVRFV